MRCDNICPYYGKNEELCDVGCGYISPHDVQMIIRYCTCTFAECMTYREPSDRLPALAGLAPCS